MKIYIKFLLLIFLSVNCSKNSESIETQSVQNSDNTNIIVNKIKIQIRIIVNKMKILVLTMMKIQIVSKKLFLTTTIMKILNLEQH